MNLTPEQATDAIRKIVSAGAAIEERGTVGVLSGAANKGFDKDVVVWFVTDSKEQGVMFPLTRDQALDLCAHLRQAVDINKGLG